MTRNGVQWQKGGTNGVAEHAYKIYEKKITDKKRHK